MNNNYIRSIQFYLAIIDFVAISILYISIKYLFKSYGLIGAEIEYDYFGIFVNVAWLLVVAITNVYHERNILSFESFTKKTIKGYLYFLLLIIFTLFFARAIVLSRIFTIVVLSSIPIVLLINRFIYLLFNQYLKRNSRLSNKVVVLGYNTLSKKLVDYLQQDELNKHIVGYCEEYENINELSNYPILSNINGALDVCKKFGVTEIYSTIAPEQNLNLYQLIQSADQNCIRFRIVPDMGYFFNRQMHIDYLKEIPVISVRKEPLEDVGNRIKKRLFDIAISSLVTVFILSWLIPIVGLLIWLESKGPIFFKQERTGKNNKNFWCLKFRSMRMNDSAHLAQATKNDARITPLGKFLRRTSLDEFPQFLNVLSGQMSVVGPRPHMLKHTDEYSQLIQQYMVRQFLKPGITGWAQVNGLRGETQTVLDMQKRVEHDLYYMENWSLLMDLKIVFLTVFKTFKGDANAF